MKIFALAALTLTVASVALAASVTLAAATTSAFAAPAEYGQITINWNPRYLSDNMVLMCDDTSLSGVELAVKGKYSVGGRLNPESYMAFESCGADWKITKKQLVEKNGEVFTLIRLRGGSACTLKVSEKPTPGVQPKAFTLEISDAC